jgi:hypothetical protein
MLNEPDDAQEGVMNFRDLSPEQFQNLGMPSVAYFKPIEYDGQHVYSIHTADGTPVALAQDREVAIAVALERNLQPIWVH